MTIPNVPVQGGQERPRLRAFWVRDDSNDPTRLICVWRRPSRPALTTVPDLPTAPEQTAAPERPAVYEVPASSLAVGVRPRPRLRLSGAHLPASQAVLRTLTDRLADPA